MVVSFTRPTPEIRNSLIGGCAIQQLPNQIPPNQAEYFGIDEGRSRMVRIADKRFPDRLGSLASYQYFIEAGGINYQHRSATHLETNPGRRRYRWVRD